MLKKKLVFIAVSLALLGASCQLKPLSTQDEPRGYADEKVTDKVVEAPIEKEPVTPSDDFNGTPAPDSGDGFPDDFNGTPAPDSGEGTTDDFNGTPAPDSGEGLVVKGGYGGKVIGEVTLKADASSIVFFLTAEKADYKGKDAYMEFGCDSLLVPVKKEIAKTQSDLAEAIVQLITTKEMAYGDLGLRNAVAPSAPKIRLTNIHYEGKTRVVDFEGSFVSAGTCDDPRIKAQISETVKLYAPDYEIRLNGTASEWRCLFDQSGSCV